MESLKFFPLKILLSFLVLSELLIWVGPIDYQIQNGLVLLLYLLLLNLCLFLGYKKGCKSFKPSKFNLSIVSIRLILFFGFYLNFISLTSMWRSHGLTLSFATLINSIINPGAAYYSDAFIVSKGTSYLWLLLSPIAWAVTPIGIYSWNKISRIEKALVIGSVLLQIVQWLGVGTRKGMIDVVLITFFLGVAKYPRLITNRAYRNKIYFISFILTILFLFYFTFSNLSRSGGETLQDLINSGVGRTFRQFYTDNIPIWLVLSIAGITSYLCQGYYALSLGLSLGVKPIVPLGMSWFTISIANKFGYDSFSDNYINTLSRFGIDPYINWHSIYLWLANDFTFIGVPIVIFIIGYFFGLVWCDCLVGKNILFFTFFIYFINFSFADYRTRNVFSYG